MCSRRLPELELLFELDPDELDFDFELELELELEFPELLVRRLELDALELRCELGRLSITAPRSVSIFRFSKL
jgi:hypothetical protein